MKYQLIKPVNREFSALQQVLTNRGIKLEDIPHYTNTTDADINSPLMFGEDRLKAAATALIQTVNNNQRCVVVVDCDCDGYTSSAILINYLYNHFPTWVQTSLDWYIHDGKQHGLNDCYDKFYNYALVIEPDAGINDGEYHKILSDNGTRCIVLDHHELEGEESQYAFCIDNYICDYPNKNFSGAGVVYQFCRYLDILTNCNYADKYLDLVAIGLSGDMMSLRSMETKHLINKGLEPDNIHNPFIFEMWQKNKFKLGEKMTSWGVVFYIVPFVNAMVRSGTQEEKELLFNSMLNFKACQMILSNKRGHKLGEEERLVDQAVRTCTNVKNRQTKAQDNELTILEQMIEDRHLLDNKVLLFLLEPGQVNKNIAGLIANKFMAKYQRPCCILTRVEDENGVSYQGSARGCDKVGVTNFKDICAATGCTLYEVGQILMALRTFSFYQRG